MEKNTIEEVFEAILKINNKNEKIIDILLNEIFTKTIYYYIPFFKKIEFEINEKMILIILII